jgi:hypothetical protein
MENMLAVLIEIAVLSKGIENGTSVLNEIKKK